MEKLPQLVSMLRSQLESGPFEIVALTLLASVVIIPITQYTPMYGFTVGYGAAVAWIGYCLRAVFASQLSRLPTTHLLVVSVMFYGLRLGGYVFLRDLLEWKPKGRHDESSPMKLKRLIRIPFALSLSFLYACMTAPMVYAIRRPAEGRLSTLVAHGGAYLAFLGAVLQAVADTHKHICKQRLQSSKETFSGPSSGLYRITRHPNYTAEVMFWMGVWLGGMPSFGFSLTAWLASSTGLYSIVMIMIGATRRLEGKQHEKYAGQKDYEAWIREVPAPLFPGVSSMNLKGFS